MKILNLYELLGLDAFDKNLRTKYDIYKGKLLHSCYNYSNAFDFMEYLWRISEEMYYMDNSMFDSNKIKFKFDNNTYYFIVKFYSLICSKCDKYQKLFDKNECIKYEHIPFRLTLFQEIVFWNIILITNEVYRKLYNENLFPYYEDILKDIETKELLKSLGISRRQIKKDINKIIKFYLN